VIGALWIKLHALNASVNADKQRIVDADNAIRNSSTLSDLRLVDVYSWLPAALIKYREQDSGIGAIPKTRIAQAMRSWLNFILVQAKSSTQTCSAIYRCLTISGIGREGVPKWEQRLILPIGDW
jgi:hypothetical protein